jgi:heme-degrading monooxygenase HmoA
MKMIWSLHEYDLLKTTGEKEFEQAILKAREKKIVHLPGLREIHFLKGIRGQRREKYAALWSYESFEAWQQNWGSVQDPRKKENYPENWKIWEKEILAPFLKGDPDNISFTTYQEL